MITIYSGVKIMEHKTNRRRYAAQSLAAGALALLLSACGEEAGVGDEGRTVEELQAVSCGPENNLEFGGVTYSAERLEDGVAFGWLCMGDPEAPVTIVEFASLTCPHCASFHIQTFPQIKSEYIETGKARLVFGNYVFNTYDMAASMVVRCGGPRRAFPLLDLFFQSQAEWYSEDAQDRLAALARRAGINRAKFDACLQNGALQRHLEAMTETAATEFGVNSTPTFFINGEELLGAQPFDAFKKLIEDKF